MNGSTSLPWSLQLHLTNKCNLRCRFCWRTNYDRKEEELTDEKFLEIVGDGCEMGIRYLTLVGGGEPLIKSNLVLAIANKIKDYEVEGCLVTNGTLFTSEISEKLVSYEWDHIALSINGATSRTDDFLRNKKDVHKRAIESIKAINHWKEKFKSEKPHITFNPVITKYNYNEIVKMIKLAYKLKIKLILFRLVNDQRKNGTFIKRNQVQKLLSQFEEAEKIAGELGVDIKKRIYNRRY